mmetsp:Transcript_28322/g.65659  ORF Transcript_28322/g.65659 Transcript_28322/m.65659 type:complete len:213 (-) Transcript_28322:16-654(-)
MSPKRCIRGLAVNAATAAASSNKASIDCMMRASTKKARNRGQCSGGWTRMSAPRHHPSKRSVKEGMQTGHASCSIRKPSNQIRNGPAHSGPSTATYVARPRTSSQTAIGAVRTAQHKAMLTRCLSCLNKPAARGVCSSSSLPGRKLWRTPMTNGSMRFLAVSAVRRGTALLLPSPLSPGGSGKFRNNGTCNGSCGWAPCMCLELALAMSPKK